MTTKFNKNMVFVSIILMDLLAGMEVDLFIPSFPELKSYFDLSPFWVEALISINYVGYCLSLFFVGGLADRYGRRPIINGGLIVFIIGSALCVWAPIYSILLLGRFLQGVGIAAPAVLSFLIIADSYPLKQQQFLISFLNGLINTAIGIAPILGSYIALYFHWQGNFITLLILGMASLVLSVIFLPNYNLSKTNETLSVRAYLPVFRSKPIMLLMTHTVSLFSPYWIFVGMAPILYIEDLGVSLSHFGFYQGSLALSFGLGSIFFGLFINRFDQKKLLQVTNQVFIFSLILMALAIIFDCNDPLLITLTFLPFVLGQIVPCSIIYPLCLNIMPHDKGRVSAVMQGTRLITSAICLQLAGHLYSGSFQSLGLILFSFMIVSVISLHLIINNQYLMNFSNETNSSSLES